ncbi:hypothetical protein [Herminiimonas sp. CN]|uniref:hypothetical protein n=1 Tax=Herminiimonas sp. CN TaxID=1349818 RepID=UPI000473CD2F|nr:hypothetical protein [Herminiimonas sp. CN]
MIRRNIAGLLLLSGLAACSKPASPDNNPLMEPVKALEQAKAVEGRLMQQAEQRQQRLEAGEK